MAHEAGQQVTHDDPPRRGAHQHGGGGEILLAECQQLRAHGTAEAGPVDHAEDQRDAEVDQQRTPIHRQGRRERHPERQLRERADDLDEPLHQAVDPAAVVAGEPAQRQADHETDGDADDADGERDARAIEDAREHVATEPIGA